MAVAAMAATAIIVGAPAAGAHPRLLTAEPKPSTVAPAPLDRITVRFDEAVQWQYSHIDVEDTDGHSVRGTAPQQLTGREAIIPLAPGTSGPLRVTWRLVGIDAHPVIGAYVFGVQSTIGGGQMSTEPALSAAQWLARDPDRSGQPQGAACRDQGVQLGELSFAVVTGRHRQFLRAPVA